MTDIEALVFDLGGVIVAHDNAVMHRRLAARCRAGWSPTDVATATADARWGLGRSLIELHTELRRDAGYDGDWAAFTADFACHLTVDQSMLSFVEALRARHRVMIFSNTNKVHWDAVTAASGGRLSVFERCLSFEIGQAKPTLRSFEILARQAGVRPDALLFFDDVAINVDGARLAGLQAEVFTGEPALRRRLSDLGFPI